MEKIAIIGTGIAGMSAAYFLQENYNLTIYEKNTYVGGHSNTINVFDGFKNCPVDTGFMVFNEETYPFLVKLFKQLGVEYKDTDMSFSVRNDDIDLEFNGCSLAGIFSQPKNIFNFKFLLMLKDIIKFNTYSNSNSFIDEQGLDCSIFDCVKKLKLGDYFLNNYLLPMASAIWSTPLEKMRDFPAKSLINFFVNHGLAGVSTQLQWKTVAGGSRKYCELLTKKFKDKIVLNSKVQFVEEVSDGVLLTLDNGEEILFDKVIIATHADQALNLLKKPSLMQEQVLSQFKYQNNQAIVHTDSTVMPMRKSNWSSWNFIRKGNDTYTVYYMNRIQNMTENMDVFININGEN
jgi:predicted NAD/FAD-binding protein